MLMNSLKKNFVKELYISQECTYDAEVLKSYFLKELQKYPNADIVYNTYIAKAEKTEDSYF